MIFLLLLVPFLPAIPGIPIAVILGNRTVQDVACYVFQFTIIVWGIMVVLPGLPFSLQAGNNQPDLADRVVHRATIIGALLWTIVLTPLVLL